MKQFLTLLFMLLVSVTETSACNDESMEYVKYGLGFHEQALYEIAILEFDKAIKMDKSCIEAYIGLGNVYLGQAKKLDEERNYENLGKKLELAKKYYRHALNLEPDNTIALNQLGLMYYRRDDFVTAKKCFEKVLEINPNDSKALMNMGNVLFWADGHFANAIITWKKALATGLIDSINAAVIWKNIGISYYKTGGKTDSANIAFSESVKFDPNSPDTYVHWGYVIELFNDPNKVIEKFEKATELDILYEPAYAAWARYLYIQRNNNWYTYKDKIDYLIKKIRKAMELDIEEANYNLHLSLLYIAKGKLKKAKEELVRATEKDPNIETPEFSRILGD